MARTLSKMLPLGNKAPAFELQDTISDTFFSLPNQKGKQGTLIAFICNHCPFVIHIMERFAKIAKEFQQKEVQVLAISSNDIVAYPEDAPPKMKQFAEKYQFTFPYLFDPTQEVAKLYDAVCTPEFYLFDSDLKLVYRGQMDDSRPGSGIKVTGDELFQALNGLCEGLPISKNQKPSVGCSIKWK